MSIGYLALTESDDDFYPSTVMNFRLGGGGVPSDLTEVFREQRGYTYGITSGFSGTGFPGPFRISSSVRSNVTLDAFEGVARGWSATPGRRRTSSARSGWASPSCSTASSRKRVFLRRRGRLQNWLLTYLPDSIQDGSP